MIGTVLIIGPGGNRATVPNAQIEDVRCVEGEQVGCFRYGHRTYVVQRTVAHYWRAIAGGMAEVTDADYR